MTFKCIKQAYAYIFLCHDRIMITAGVLLHKDFISLQESDSLASLIGHVQQQQKICVFKGKEFRGLFDPYLLFKSRIDVKEMKLRSLISKPPLLHKNDNFEHMATLFFMANAAYLPVVNGQFFGVVDVLDLFAHLQDFKTITIQNVRHPQFIGIQESESIDTVQDLMYYHHLDRLPVLDKKKVVGFVSYSDLLLKYYIHHLERQGAQQPRLQTRAFTPNNPPVLQLSVKNIMARGKLYAVDETDSIVTAAEKMRYYGVLSLLVRRKGILDSIITKRDILEAVMPQKSETMNIQFVGLHEIPADEYTKTWVRKLASYYGEKLGYLIHNDVFITLHLKTYKEQGTRQKFSANCRVTFPGGTVASNRAVDWNLRKAVHKSFRSLENELRARYRYNAKALPSARKGEL